MTPVFAVGALGVIISITGGLFLRRLLGQVAELRRQITGIDREMRAQRARVTFLRQLIFEDEGDTADGDPPLQIAVGHDAGPEPGDAYGPRLPKASEPIRRKGHLALYLGGAVAAAVASAGITVRNAVRTHQAQTIATLAGTALAAATVSLAGLQPWSDDVDRRPASVPTAASSPSYTPLTGPHSTQRSLDSTTSAQTPLLAGPEQEPGVSETVSGKAREHGKASPRPTLKRAGPTSASRKHSPRPTAPAGKTHTPRAPGSTRSPGPPGKKPPGRGRSPSSALSVVAFSPGRGRASSVVSPRA